MLAPVLDAASVLQYVSWACLLLPHVPSPHSLFPGRLHEADLADLTASCCSQHQMISSHVSVMCLSPGGRRAAWAIYFTSELVPWPISIVALSADHLVYQSAGALVFFPPCQRQLTLSLREERTHDKSTSAATETSCVIDFFNFFIHSFFIKHPTSKHLMCLYRPAPASALKCKSIRTAQRFSYYVSDIDSYLRIKE